MTDLAPQFPFGSPLEPRPPSATGERRLFLLGAYPSALHVQWKPPAPFERVAALAVDNEPEPFWTGDDEMARIDAWAKRVSWQPAWGTVRPAGPLNGSSGLWVEEKVLGPLGVARAETWITDCLDTYRFSKGQQDVVTGRFAPFAEKLGLPWHGVADALRHPTEDEIFNEARLQHLPRLKAELEAARPTLVVTLGNAALRVLARLVDVRGEVPETLAPGPGYGAGVAIRIGGRPATWFPLVHPGQRSQEWQAAHARWMSRTRPPQPPAAGAP